VLRNWERNGLIAIPRDPGNGYRRLGKAGYSMMSMLRMFLQLDRGETRDLRRALDTPRPDEDLYTAADRWLSTLVEQETCSQQAAALIDEILARSHTP
jgi:hypothetical protein